MSTSKPRALLSTGSWALYDFSDTIFSASILTFYFPLWVTDDKGGTDTHIGLALSASMLIVALTGPFLGTLSDRLNRRIPLLALSVVSCAVFTALIGAFGGLTTGLLFFIAANFLYQTGLIFYNSLIINVSDERQRGIVSGIGVGAGYIGLIAAFLIMRPIVDTQGNQAAFLPTAGLFILFALPLILIVKEPGARGHVDKTLFQTSYKQLYQTFKRARQHSNLFRFLIGRFMYMEAINTVTSFYVLYLINVGGFEDTEAQTMIIGVVVIAIFASWATGFLVSRYGPKRVLIIALSGWTALAIAAVIADTTWAFWAVAVTMGILLGRTTNLRPRPTHIPLTKRTNRRILRTLPNVRTPLRRHRTRPLGPNNLGPIRNRRTSLPNSPSHPSDLPSGRPPSPPIRPNNPRNLRPRRHKRRHARRAIRTFCNLALSSVRPIVHRSEQFSMRPRIRRFRLVLP